MTVAQSALVIAIIAVIVFVSQAVIERRQDKPIAPWLVRLLGIPEEEDN